MSGGVADLQTLQNHLQAMEQGMGDGEQPDDHPLYKLPEPGLEGTALCTTEFQQPQELELQESRRPAPAECTSAQSQEAPSILVRPSHSLLCVEEEIKNQKRPRLSNGSQASSNFISHFPRALSGPEPQGLPPLGHILHSNSLDLNSRRPQVGLERTRTLDNPRATRSGVSVLHRPSTEQLESPSLNYGLEDCCPWSSRVPPGGNGVSSRASKVTGLYAELVKELELQMSELRNLLTSREEAAMWQERRIKELELENQKLKSQLRNLEEQNDLLSSRNRAGAAVARTVLGPGNSCVDINESNIQFLKSLVVLLENNAALQVSGLQPFSSPSAGEQRCTPADVPKSPPLWRMRAGVPSGFPSWMSTEDSSGSPATLSDATCLWEENIQDTLPDGTPVWASPVEENGRPKLELIPNSGVYITHHQLDDLSQVSTDKPKLMTRRLLDYFFSRETLARSSATGQRIAHNNTTMEKPIRLPVAVVNAIKEYVCKVCGRGCNFNAVINSKCGTSRRAVKKMIIKME
uniref:BEN domain-containing protein n=1 Tax=Pelusios castaneus TaxID=367368 RepID=A0A8C8R7L7_9SAUR